MPEKGEALRYTHRSISADTLTKGFECGEKDIDVWLDDDALRCAQRGTVKVTCAHLVGNPNPIGFFAVASAVESVNKLPGFHYHRFGEGKFFPCLQLVYVAVRKEFQGRKIGSTMVGSATALFAEVGSQISLPHMILIPINESVTPFYKKLGFESYDKGARMFLSLQAARDAFDTERPT